MINKYFFEHFRRDFRLPRWEELPDIELYMEQVITLMGKYLSCFSPQNEPLVTSSMINNYVKIGVLPPPVKKKYSRSHLFRLFIICTMKRVLPINDIAALIETLLETRTEEEVFDIFTSSYEEEYLETVNLLENMLKRRTSEKKKTAISLSIIRAAAIADASILFSEQALTELQRDCDTADNQPKKTSRKAKVKVFE